MDFFGSQEAARRQTAQLVVFFALAVLVIILAVYAVVSLAAPFLGIEDFSHTPHSFWDAERLAWVGGLTLLIVTAGSAYKIRELHNGGGAAVADMLGGTMIPANTGDPLERRLLNVVAEMAIASGTPSPPVYLLDAQGINAFAAGFSPDDAIIGVTRGCVQLLNRDQLQGVIAHEFSHILNGDTLIKMRLMGVLHGIMLLSDAGMHMCTGTLRANRYARRRARVVVSLPWVIVGFLIFMLGAVGLVLGDLIKRAVSRQREFLADAAAVQFTRNTEGVAGALKAIGGYKEGSRVAHPNAGQASHLFFGSALKGFMAQDWWATHPPLAERIRHIEPGFNGLFEAVNAKVLSERNRLEAKGLVSALAGGATSSQAIAWEKPERVIESIGRPTHNHAQHAKRLLADMPRVLRESADEPYSARAIVYALLLDHDAAMRKAQLRILHEHADPEVFRMTSELQSACHDLDPGLRLPLVDLTLPALRLLSKEQYRLFRSNVRRLIKSDEKISLFEYVLHRLLLRHLDSGFNAVEAPGVKYRNLEPVIEDCTVVLAMLAHQGHRLFAEAEKAFADGASELDIDAGMPGKGQCSLKRFDVAIIRLRLAAPPLKKRVLTACAACVFSDGKASVAQSELLRALADGMGCPMPPLLSLAD